MARWGKMERLVRASTEAELYGALRSLRVGRGVVLWEALEDTCLGRETPPARDLVAFAVASARGSPGLWSPRVRQQYRWTLMRLPE